MLRFLEVCGRPVTRSTYYGSTYYGSTTTAHLMKRSLFTGLDFLVAVPLGVSVHISLTFSRTMLQCLSKALTRPSSFLLFLQLMSTCVLLFTLCVSTDRGPVENSSSSVFSFSSLVAARRLPNARGVGWG